MALYVKFDCATCENENCYGHSLPIIEKVCDGYKHTGTNADRLRAMSDEELADYFSELTCFPGANRDICKGVSNCYVCWLDWLKAPAGKEGEG